MGSKLLVNATFIDQHAGLLDTRSRLPMLVRKLVQRTVSGLRRNQFRTDEGIQLEGWDGIVEADQATACVPLGLSGWEMGVTKGAKGKADSDYQERKRDPLGLIASETTFVFVTPRRWRERDKWSSTKRKENFWKDVVALDAENLAAWLETAPGVHIWLSNEMGKYPGGVTDLTTWWEDWVAETDGRVTSDMLLAGRETTVTQVEQWLKGEEGTFALQAGTRGEAIAVLAAVVLGLPDDERADWLDQVVVVRSLEGWRQLSAQETDLLLVPEFTESLGDNIGGALRRHRVLLPLDGANLSERGVTLVSPIQAGRLREVLEQAGYARPEVDELALLGRRSFTEFRRRWLKLPASASPPWATAAGGQTLLPALLVGAWEEGNDADRSVVEQLANVNYEEYREQLVEWMHSPAPPIREVAGTWFVIDKAGAWEQLRRLTSKDLLGRFADVTQLVLGLQAPRAEAKPDNDIYQAWRAGTRLHSARLRHALADSLALLGADDATHAVAITTRSLLSQLFEQANAAGDERGWVAFGSNVRLLAEAAPDLFLDAVLTDLSVSQSVVSRLFNETDEGFFPHSDHTGLLWALESLAWNPEYLPDAALALAKLAQLDPGGNLANRPRNSLREIFLLWHPQTMADSTDRFEVVDQLRRAEPEVAWNLLLRLLPKHHDVGSQNAMPRWRWREWNAQQPGAIGWNQLFQDVAQLSDRLLEDAAQNPYRWVGLVDQLGEWLRYVSPEHRERILSGLETVAASDLPDEGRTVLRKEVQDLLARHRQHSDAVWAMPLELLKRLDSVYAVLQPLDVVQRTAWLFTQWPKLPEGRKGKGHVDGMRETEAAQDSALAEVYAAGGQEEVLRLAAQVPEPFYVGRAILRTSWGPSVLAEWLTLYLASAIEWQESLAEGLVAAYVTGTSREEAEQFGLQQAPDWTPAQAARFFARLPTDPQTWNLLNGLGPEVVTAYWQWVWPYGIQSADVEVAVRQLLGQRRAASALDLLSSTIHGGDRPAVPLVLDALAGLLRDGTDQDRIKRNQRYELEELIEYLDEDPDADRARALEIAFLLSKVFYSDKVPKIIARELSENPRLFVRLHLVVYRQEEEEERPVIEEGSLEFVRWESAYNILEHWHTLPGTGSDGQVDVTVTRTWINEVRALAAPVSRLDLCDRTIGKIIAHSKEGIDGIWPQEAVCTIMEEVVSKDFLEAIYSGRYNIHGRTHPVTGGMREGGIAEGYKQAVRARRTWPRTARVLRKLADTFDKMAGQGREDANLREQIEP